MTNLTIGRKLLLAFGVVATCVLASGAVATLSLRSAEHSTLLVRTSSSADKPRRAMMLTVPTELSAIRGYLMSGDRDFLNERQRQRSIYLANLAAYRALENNPGRLAKLTEADDLVKRWQSEAIANLLTLYADPATRAQAMTSASANWLRRIEASFGELSDLIDGETLLERQEQSRALAIVGYAIAAGAGLTLISSVLLALALRRTIADPVRTMTVAMGKLAAGDTSILIPAKGRRDEIGQMAMAVQVFAEALTGNVQMTQAAASLREAADAERSRHEAQRAASADQQAVVVSTLADALERLSAGDLTHRLEDAFDPEYETLRQNYNGAIARLQSALRVIAANAAGIRSGTDEITQAADDLSRRTEQQAASLEQTAAALDQITATVRKTADGATQARRMVTDAKTDAEHSGTVVQSAVDAMGAIEESSSRIGQIIGTIDEIAFQTNLLALNAGVEAARAGDAGRGFAVVASEVRALAQRSADAAREIKSLISTSSQHVSRGVTLVGDTGLALTRIVDQVMQITTVVAEIASSAQEQAAGLQEVNTAINQMDQVTQQNAAMVEQSTAASHALADETAKLIQAASVFQLGKAGDTAKPIRQGITAAAPMAKAIPKSAGRRQVGEYVPAPAQTMAISRNSTALAEAGWEEF